MAPIIAPPIVFRPGPGKRPIEVVRVRITDAGRLALVG
jgi:hypothetical protein